LYHFNVFQQRVERVDLTPALRKSFREHRKLKWKVLFKDLSFCFGKLVFVRKWYRQDPFSWKLNSAISPLPSITKIIKNSLQIYNLF